MELIKVNSKQQLTLEPALTAKEKEEQISSDIHFMSANTIPMSIEEIKEKHIIPVFSKSNERTISHTDFLESVDYVARQIYSGEQILKPAIRVSHKISGRHPNAVHKSVKELQECDITTFYERIAFVIEIPSITANIAGNTVCLAVGGVRSYHETNLNSRKTEERFKIFAGFVNKICTNLCISSDDGFLADVRIRTISELAKAAYDLFGNYNVYKQIETMNNLPNTVITESQFAQILGRARMYHNMPWKNRKSLPLFPLTDNQVSQIAKDYYTDESYCRDNHGDINLWKLYNLFTGANKSSYIDSFLDRGVSCLQFVNGLYQALGECKYHWFVN